MTIILALVGLIILLFGAQFFVDGSIDIAKRFGISEFLIGLTLVTVGTNIPEIVVAITGGLYRLQNQGVSDLIVGEIIGSNIGQIGLILGIIGLLGVMDMSRKALLYQSIFLVGSVILLYVFGQDFYLSRIEGLVLVLLYVVYMIPLSRFAQKVAKKEKTQTNLWIEIPKMMVGLIGIVFGAKLAIDNSILLAEQFHINQALVGILLLGLGTSLPELIVAVMAYAKRASGISIGNIIGSNIIDGLLALGLGASVAGFNISYELMKFDIPFLLFLSVVVILFFYTRDKFERKESILLLILYFGYILVKIATAM